MEEKDTNKIFDRLEWNLRIRLSHLEITKYNPVELHDIIEDIVSDEIKKIKISTI